MKINLVFLILTFFLSVFNRCDKKSFEHKNYYYTYKHTNKKYPYPDTVNVMNVFSYNDQMVSYSKSEIRKTFSTSVLSTGDGNFRKVKKLALLDSIPYIIINDFSNNMIYSKDRTFDPERLLDTIITFDYYKQKLTSDKWKLSDEYKKIGDYKCRLATIQYNNCEKYSCWFYENSDHRVMPWKFPPIDGLPIKIQSEDDQILFELENFEIEESNENQRLFRNLSHNEIEYLSIKSRYTHYEESHEKALNKLRSILPEGTKVNIPKIDIACY